MKNVAFLLLILTFLNSSLGQIRIDRILVENRVNPMGLDISSPRFTWVMSSSERNKMQSAYEIKVAMSAADLSGDNLLWTSGKVESDQSTFVEYTGPELQSRLKYFWQVRVWDERDNNSGWSDPGFWQMGFLDPENEFVATWITPGYEESIQRESPLFRKSFQLDSKNVARATAYITAHGMYEAWINGQRIGDDYFTPGWTSYENRLQYQVYDVTKMLQSGENAIGIMLGNGWYRGFLAWGDRNDHYGSDIAVLYQLDIEFEDGSTQRIVTDDSWVATKGPVVFSELYDGETYDSQKEIEGWNTTGFKSLWPKVKEANFPKDVLIATYNEPIRKQERINPIDIFKSPKGELIVDFGQNLVGWVQLKVKESDGDKLEIFHAEVLDKEGNFYVENLRSADQKMTYILDGSEQVLEPHFTFQGFRYIQVVGYPGELKPENLTAIALYSDMIPTGDFTCSDPLVNKLQENIQWGQKGNFLDVPTDCPQRDERLGWTGDAQAFFRTAAYNMNVHNFFSKWMKDVAADQSENGAVPFVVPNVLGPNATGSAGWADVATIIPWESYLLYGDERMLEEQYPSMKSWVEYIKSQSQDNLWKSGFHFGDWLFYRPDDDNAGRAAVTDRYYITQCFYGYSTQLLINAAEVLGYSEDAQAYSALLADIKIAFQNEFLSASGRLGPNTQTAYVLALQFDMLPEDKRDQAVQRLVDNIKSYNYHLTTGFLGTPYLCHVLSRFGREDIAYELMMQDTYPSWLYPVTMGATTIWERWDGIKPDSTFQTPSMNSYNHYAYGAIGDWMYRNVAGINAVALSPGYKQMVIKPIPGGGLNAAEGSLNTYYGKIVSGWSLESNRLVQNLTIPVNTTAEVWIPSTTTAEVEEGGKALDKIKEIEVLGQEEGYLKVLIGSGDYQFTIPREPITDSNRYDAYIGNYSSFGGVTIIHSENGNLMMTQSGNTEVLRDEGNDVFSLESDPSSKIRFKRSRTNSVLSMEMKMLEFTMQAAKQ